MAEQTLNTNGSGDMAEEDSKAAPYIAWGTMNNAMDRLAQGVPNRIDRSVFDGLSGGVQSQLMAGMKFLGLITADRKPTPALYGVAVTDLDARKKKLAPILRERYADLFALDLMKTTPALVVEKMGESYNVEGSTRKKAVRFFLSAVDYVGIPVSPLFSKAKSGGNGGAVIAAPRRRRGPKPRASQGITPPARTHEGAARGMTRTVKLESGGELTLSASVDLFELNEKDMKFVLDMVNQMKAYDQTGATA